MAAPSASPQATTWAISPAPCRASAPPAWTFLEALIACDTPIVASVNGAAVGVGTTMLLHCDLVYCSAARGSSCRSSIWACARRQPPPCCCPPRRALRAVRTAAAGGAVRRRRRRRTAGIVNAVLPTRRRRTRWARRGPRRWPPSRPRRCAPPAPCCAGTGRTCRRSMRQEGAEFARLLHGPEAREALRPLGAARARFHPAGSVRRVAALTSSRQIGIGPPGRRGARVAKGGGL